MHYVDGFVIAVPNANRDRYLHHATVAAAMFREFGALEIVECWGDDVPEGKLTSFPKAVQRKDDENVVFSWITWPSKAVRDVGMRKFMDDPRMRQLKDMPFDGQRMIFGGFQMIIENK